MQKKETIIAIATGSSSSGGLGVIRISGSYAQEILHAVFMPKHMDQAKNFAFKPRYMHYGFFVLQEENGLCDKKCHENASAGNTLNENVSGGNTPEINSPNTHVSDTNNTIFYDNLSTDTQQNDSILVSQKSHILDEVLAVYFPAPFSYTGEDVAEIHAHGGSALLNSMLEYLLSVGQKLGTSIRHAEAGEFTKRAFLNGRIDLSQAEAVAEIIAAPVVEGVKLAAAKLSGALGRRIEDLRGQIEYIRRRLCLAIDFPEEEGECLPSHEFHALLDSLQEDLSKLISAYERARPWSEGSLVVLAGQVNAGKSSLMNAILGRKRAIVTSEAGTTRDYLEEHTFLDGLSVRLTDTAGLREIAWLVEHTQEMLQKTALKENNLVDFNTVALSPEILKRLEHTLSHYAPQHFHTKSSIPISLIEAEGICRSLELMEEAQLILLVFDGFSLTNRLLQDQPENQPENHPEKFPEKVIETSFQQISMKHVPLLASFMQEELALLPQHVKKICIWNKTDKAPIDVDCALAMQKILGVSVLCLNAKTNTHNGQKHTSHSSIDDLAKMSRKLLVSQELNTDEIAPNRRQAQLLQKAQEELSYLKEEIDILPPDLTAIRLESAGQFLSSITGICSIDETFNAIFEDFCIGK